MKPLSIFLCFYVCIGACFKAANTFRLIGAFFACCFVAFDGGYVVAVIERVGK